ALLAKSRAEWQVLGRSAAEGDRHLERLLGAFDRNAVRIGNREIEAVRLALDRRLIDPTDDEVVRPDLATLVGQGRCRQQRQNRRENEKRSSSLELAWCG